MPSLNIPQAQFLNLPNKFRAYVAGFGGGKTWSGCASLCKHHWEFPTVNSGYFAPSYPQIRDIFYPTIEECAYDWGLRVDIKSANKEVHFYSGRTYRGTTICRSMDNPSSIVGFKIGQALVDELDTLPTDKAREAWRKIIARMRYKVPKLKNGIDVTTTPEGFKFTYEQFVKEANSSQRKGELYGLIQASTYDNELNLPDDYIESLKESYPPQLIEAYLNGLFVNLTSGAVYPDFDRQLNASFESVQNGDVLHVGMDFNVLKMAAVVHVIRDNNPHAVDELVGVRDTPTMAVLLKERYPNHKICIYPDAAGQATSSKNSSESDHAILRQHGFTLYVNGTNPAIKDRLNAMNSLVLNSQGERRYYVNPLRCPELTGALEQQVYDKFGMPDKTSGLDHTCFTGDTLVTTKDGIFRFDELPKNGFVLSPYGDWVEYENPHKTGNKITYSITFANGYMVQCTPDHKFLTTEGWVCAKDLKDKQLLLSVPQSKNLTESPITCAENISKIAPCKKSDYIEQYGFITLVKFLLIAISIISTMTLAIIKSKTLLVLMSIAIVAIMVLKMACQFGLFKKALKQQKNGTQVKQGMNGISNNTKKQKINFTQLLKLNAIFAVTSLSNKWLAKIQSETSALKNVAQPIAEHQELTISTKLANNVGIHSEQTNIKRHYIAQQIAGQSLETLETTQVTSISFHGVEDVYCLTVPKYGCFKLSENSPIVSNCDAGGYFIAYKYPVIKPVTRLRRKMRMGF